VGGVQDLTEIVGYGAGTVGLPGDKGANLSLIKEERHIGNLHGHATRIDVIVLEQLGNHGVLNGTGTGGTDFLTFKVFDGIHVAADDQGGTFLVTAGEDINLHPLSMTDGDRNSAAGYEIKRAGSHFLHDVGTSEKFTPLHSVAFFLKHVPLFHDHNSGKMELVSNEVTNADFFGLSIDGEPKEH